MAIKPEALIASKRERRRLAHGKVRPGSVLIKYFRNIATTDLIALYPNVRVVMSTFDKLALGLPALAGGVPIALSLTSTLTVLFLVVGFFVSTVGMMMGGVDVARSIMLPTVLVLVAMFSTSLYFTFRDSFRADDDAGFRRQVDKP